MRFSFAALLLIMIASAGCESHATVRTHATPGTDFQKYHTYAIKPGSIVYPGASQDQRKNIEQKIQDAIAGELEGRGLTPKPDEPELIITYTAGARKEETGAVRDRAPTGVDVRNNGTGYDEPGPIHVRDLDVPAADSSSRSGYTEGNLVIDLLDGKSNKLVWRATAQLEVASDQGGKRIPGIVAKAFQDVELGHSPAAR